MTLKLRAGAISEGNERYTFVVVGGGVPLGHGCGKRSDHDQAAGGGTALIYHSASPALFRSPIISVSYHDHLPRSPQADRHRRRLRLGRL